MPKSCKLQDNALRSEKHDMEGMAANLSEIYASACVEAWRREYNEERPKK